MKNIILLLLLMFVSLSSYSESKYTSKEYRDSIILARQEYFDEKSKQEKIRTQKINDIIIKNADTTIAHIDTCIQTGGEIFVLLKNGVKKHGLKKTIQINANIFLPFFIFLILYLLWLKNRK